MGHSSVSINQHPNPKFGSKWTEDSDRDLVVCIW